MCIYIYIYIFMCDAMRRTTCVAKVASCLRIAALCRYADTLHISIEVLAMVRSLSLSLSASLSLEMFGSKGQVGRGNASSRKRQCLWPAASELRVRGVPCRLLCGAGTGTRRVAALAKRKRGRRASVCSVGAI